MLGRDDTRQRRHDKTKRFILKQAKNMIRSNGVDKFSLRALAAKCDYSPAGLYEYFSSKQALMQAIALGIEKEMKYYLEQAGVGNDLDDLKALGLQYIAYGKNNPEDYLLLFTAFTSGRSSENDTLPETSAYMVLVRMVSKLVEGNHLVLQDNVTIEELCYNYWVLLHGHVMMQLTLLKNYTADFEAIESRMLARFVDALTM